MLKLPLNCQAHYIEAFISKADSDATFDWIINHCPLNDCEDIPMADGSSYQLDTGKYMFVDMALTDPQVFSIHHGRRMFWPPAIMDLKQKVELFTGISFSVCVCILYRDGTESIGFHYDAPAFGSTSVLPSISLGSPREFVFRDKQNHSDQFNLLLGNGSMVLMGEGCQENYEHSLPEMRNHPYPRVNLTFRQFDWSTVKQNDN